MRLVPAVAPILLSLFIAAPSTYAAAGSKSPCDLLTLSEVATLAGVPMSPGRPGGPTCMYASTNGPSYVSLVMAVNTSVSEAMEFFDMTLATEKSRSGQHPAPEQIAGLGEHALLSYDNGGAATLTVVAHLTVLQMEIRAGTVPMTPARKQLLLDAMKKALARL